MIKEFQTRMSNGREVKLIVLTEIRIILAWRPSDILAFGGPILADNQKIF